VKLLLYSHYFAPSIGGVETIVESLARGLVECRALSGVPEFDVTLVTQTPAGNYDDHALPFCVVRRPGLLALLRLIRRADIVHLAGPALPPMLLGLLARRPVVIEHHGFQTICPNGQLLHVPSQSPCPGHFQAGRHAECLRCNKDQGTLASIKLWLLAFVRAFLAARVAANVMPTQWLGHLLNLPRAVGISHGLDTSRPLPAPEPANSDPVIAFQGRLVTTKGVRVLFDAAHRLQEQSVPFELHLIGQGPDRENLTKLAQEWGLAPRIRFAGALPAPGLEAALARADIVVVPSLGGEVFGLVVAENMLRGLPVVASDLGAFAEVIGDAGIMFRTGDAADLARQLAALLQDEALRKSLGHRARQRVLDFFSKGRMIEAHAVVYRKLQRTANR
jgi:glycogen(starch) synthase